MKDFDQSPVRVEQHEERQQEQKYRLVGDMLRHPGMVLYEYNSATKVLRRAPLKEPPKTEVVIPMPKVKKEKPPKGQVFNPEYLLQRHAEENKRTVANVIYTDGCDYFYALNDKSAQKKLFKMMKRGLIRTQA